MKNRQQLNAEFLMRIPIFLIIAAIIFNNVSWLPKIAGIALIISAILTMIKAYKDKVYFSKYIVYIALVISGIYLIIN